jgi:hypothetical protein
VSYIFSKDLCAAVISGYPIITPGLEISVVVILEFFVKKKKKNKYRAACSAMVFIPSFNENMSVQVMNLSVAKPHHKVVCFKC